MRIPFVKMHGLGNDFVVLDARHDALLPITSDLARALADRRTGIGCDQLVLLEPSERADFRMRIFNNDGGEVGACGNASRAVALLHGKAASIETASGLIEARLANLEALVGHLSAQLSQTMAPQPFIGQDLRPDLSQGALADEDDAQQAGLPPGPASGKRMVDTKSSDV